VDEKLGEFEDLLAHTLRTVGKGRSHLRAPLASAGSARPYDYQA